MRKLTTEEFELLSMKHHVQKERMHPFEVDLLFQHIAALEEEAGRGVLVPVKEAHELLELLDTLRLVVAGQGPSHWGGWHWESLYRRITHAIARGLVKLAQNGFPIPHPPRFKYDLNLVVDDSKTKEERKKDIQNTG